MVAVMISTISYTFKILPRPEDLGGGWRLYLLEDGQEVGGGIFPAEEYEGIAESLPRPLNGPMTMP